MAVEIGDAGPVLLLFAYAFVFHIILVNFDLGLAMIIPFLKRHGEKTNNQFYLQWSRKYMRYLAIVYASAGVFATAFTVFLLTFYPPLIPLISDFLFVPYALAMVFLGVRLFSISAYWYTWNRLTPEKHYYLGLMLASTSFLVPFTLRLPMAFFNTPTGVISINPPRTDPFQLMFLNPTFWPFYLKSILGSIVLTCFILALVHTYHHHHDKNDDIDADKELESRMVKFYLKIGGVALLLLLLMGTWYLLSLAMTSSFKFNNIIGRFLGKTPRGLDMSPLFVLKMVVVTIQVVLVAFFLQKLLLKNEEITIKDEKIRRLIYLLAPLAVFGIIIGEIMNGLAQFPYLIAQPELVDQLPALDTNTILNPVAAVFDLYVISIFALGPLLLAFLVLMYYLLSGKLGNQTASY